MGEETQDANTAAAPSTAAEAPVQPAEQQQQPSSEGAEPSMADTIKTIVDANNTAVSQAAGTKEGQDAPSDVQKLDKTEAEEEQPGQAQEAGQHEEEEQPPFHEHPRWKEVTAQRDQFKAQIAETEPLVKAQKDTAAFCQQYGITPEDYQQAMTVWALLKTDPAAAREALKPVWDSLSGYDGNHLSPELQARVDAREITPEVAQELAQLQAKVNSQETRGKLTAAQQAQRQVQSVAESVATWDKSKRGTDPDFKPAGANQPEGLWENTQQRLVYLWSQQPPKTQQEAMALCERAYNDSKKFFTARFPKQSPSRTVPTTRSSQPAPVKDPAKAESTSELVRSTVAQVAAKHGIRFSPPEE